MVHHRQGLPFGFEPGDDLPGVHARLDDLQGHAPPDRLRLLGQVDDAKPPLANLLQQLIGSDDRAGGFDDGLVAGWDVVENASLSRQSQIDARAVQKAIRLIVDLQQGLDLTSQLHVPGTQVVEKDNPCGRVRIQRSQKDVFCGLRRLGHEMTLLRPLPISAIKTA